MSRLPIKLSALHLPRFKLGQQGVHLLCTLYVFFGTKILGVECASKKALGPVTETSIDLVV